ncbi:MAG: NAD(P)H-dependent glycerol-3-phosphate dehydrogenase [Ruminococcaceae bacterium]|nr:NAD(P)H-dependent glycerol-3-phosphate dehydrogenase [Oscillospiraceae bacterium]
MGEKISVIGSGSWGTAIASLLCKNGHDVTLWSYTKEQSEELIKYRENKKYLPKTLLPLNMTFTSDLSKAAENEIIFMVTPSSAVKETAEKMAPFIKEGTIIVNASKGLEEKTQKRLSEVIKEAIPKARLAVMSGPSHAEEVALFLPTTNVVASEDIDISQRLQDILMNDTFRVYTGTDMAGVEIGGALKNVIALAAGISDGLGFGDNTKAALMTRGMQEISRLGIALGAEPETFFGLSGIGDLIVTCTSMHSRNRRAGILIGKGYTPSEAVKEIEMVVEGFYTTKSAYILSQRTGVDMPIVTETYKILFENKPAKDAVLNLMCRDKKHESEKNLLI